MGKRSLVLVLVAEVPRTVVRGLPHECHPYDCRMLCRNPHTAASSITGKAPVPLQQMGSSQNSLWCHLTVYFGCTSTSQSGP